MDNYKKSRTYNLLINSIVGIVSAIINIFLNFIVRIVIVHYLGDEINGIHSLFQSLVSVMTIAETSMTTAMVVKLYKPIHDRDEKTIQQLMRLYKKIYRWIAVVFLGFSIVLNIFLEYFVHTKLEIKQVHYYFLLFICSYVLNYITYCDRCMLFAEQKNRISALCTMLGEIIFRGTGLVLVILLHRYDVFLICLIIEKLFSNFMCQIYVRRKNSYLMQRHEIKENKSMWNELFTTIKPLFTNQIAFTIQNSSTSVIISMLLENVAIVGFYGNYQMVTSAISVIFSQFGSSFTSGFGNLVSGNDDVHVQKVFRRAFYLISMAAVIFSCGFLCCIQDFIMLAFGKERLLSMSETILLMIGMYISLLNIPIVSVQNATGTHRLDVGWMIGQAVMVVLISVIGGKIWGLDGILLGTSLPVIVITTFHKGFVIAEKCMHMKKGIYLKDLLRNTGVFFIAVVATALVTSNIEMGSYLVNFLVKGVIAVALSSACICGLTFNTEGFKYLIRLVSKK